MHKNKYGFLKIESKLTSTKNLDRTELFNLAEWADYNII